MLNRTEPERWNPRHKHFRWQKDKSTIPPFIHREYGNTIQAETLEDLNRLTRRPSDCRHILIRKCEAAWLKSVLNWGMKWNKFSDKHIALQHLDVLQKEYHAYCAFWEKMQAEYPEYVRIIEYEEIQNNMPRLIQHLSAIGLSAKPRGFDGVLEHVAQSPKGRASDVTVEDVMAAMDGTSLQSNAAH
ncbi:MAG: hypothetical protein AAFS08_17585 [Pseudomonadota bacterium]